MPTFPFESVPFANIVTRLSMIDSLADAEKCCLELWKRDLIQDFNELNARTFPIFPRCTGLKLSKGLGG